MEPLTFKKFNTPNFHLFKEDLILLYKKFNQFYIDNNYNEYLDKKENDEIDFETMTDLEGDSSNLVGMIIYDGTNPVGYILGYTEELNEYFTGGNVGYIDGVFVDESYRGKGLAKKLVEYFCEEMKIMNIHIIRLGVKAKNISAIKLYESLGFGIDQHRMYKKI